MHKHWFAIFKVNITAKVQNVRECLSEWYLLNRGTFCYQTCQVDTASLARASCRKCSLLSSRSSSQRELIWSNFDFIYYILWTADFLATKLSLTVHHQKPECLVKKWIALLSNPPNIPLPNLVWWYIVMSRSVMQNDWFAIFMVKVSYYQNMTVFTMSSVLPILWLPNLVCW